jgi:hypothetical protein
MGGGFGALSCNCPLFVLTHVAQVAAGHMCHVWQVVEALVVKVAGLVIKVAVGSRDRCGDLR